MYGKIYVYLWKIMFVIRRCLLIIRKNILDTYFKQICKQLINNY